FDGAEAWRADLRLSADLGVGRTSLPVGDFSSLTLGIVNLEGDFWFSRHLGMSLRIGDTTWLPFADTGGIGQEAGWQVEPGLALRTTPMGARNLALTGIATIGVGPSWITTKKMSDAPGHIAMPPCSENLRSLARRCLWAAS